MATALLLTAGLPPAQTPPGLSALAAIARARSERQRPAQIAALQPFLKDLSLDYKANSEFLDTRIKEIAALGDGTVPLLLEMLAPSEEGDDRARNTAANAARVLLHLDPSSFVDALLEIVRGKSFTASGHAIWLLGYTHNRRAGQELTALLERLRRPHRIRAVEALTRLGARQAAPKIAILLASGDRKQRQAAMAFLAKNPVPSVLDTVLKALSVKTDLEMFETSLSYLEQAAKRNEHAAKLLLPLLRDDRLDADQRILLVAALGQIAPSGHRGTLEACHAILAGGETGRLGRTSALTMLGLGDKSGERLLLDTLKARIANDRRDGKAYIDRGDTHMALGNWRAAVRDYEEAIRWSRSRSVKELVWILVAHCEAHRRDRSRQVLQALKNANVTFETLMKESEQDAALRRVLRLPALRRWVKALPRKEEAPKRGEDR